MTRSEDLNIVIADISRDINSIDQATIPLGLRNPKAFEYCIFLILLDALDNIDGVKNISPCNLDPKTNRFKIPGSPRLFYSDYSYYSFDYKASSYEVHLGVQYKGDTTLHEADVSIIKKNHAEKSRHNHISPNRSSLVALFECKYYTGSLKIAESRELVGLKDDFLQKGLYYFVSNSSGSSTQEYFSKPNRPNLYDRIEFSNNKNALNNFQENIKSDLQKRLIFLKKINSKISTNAPLYYHVSYSRVKSSSM